MTTHEQTELTFRSRFRTPDMARVEAITGSHGGSLTNDDRTGTWTYAVSFRADLPHESAQKLRRYLEECGFELVGAKHYQSVQTVEDLDLRLFQEPAE